jgi:hypothetical protein
MCLTLASFVLPAGEVALVLVATAPARSGEWVRRPNREPADCVSQLCVTRAADDNGLQGGPDDDDFQPSPDRTCDADGPDGSVSRLDPGVPAVFCTAGSPTCGASLYATVAGLIGGCPALDTSVQFLC